MSLAFLGGAVRLNAGVLAAVLARPVLEAEEHP